MSQICGK